VSAKKPRPPERPLRSIAYVGPAQIRGKRRVGSASTHELGDGCPGELRDPLCGLPETAPAGTGAVSPAPGGAFSMCVERRERDMQKVRKWWRVPVTLSWMLGFVPAMYAVLGAFYGFGNHVAAGLGVLSVILVAIWTPALIVLGIRRLKAR
jgi:hypothetical protein